MFTRYSTDGFLKSVRSVDCTTLYTLYTYTSEHNQLSERFSASLPAYFFLPAVVLVHDEKKSFEIELSEIYNYEKYTGVCSAY